MTVDCEIPLLSECLSWLAVAANWVLVVTGSVVAGVRGQEMERGEESWGHEVSTR